MLGRIHTLPLIENYEGLTSLMPGQPVDLENPDVALQWGIIKGLVKTGRDLIPVETLRKRGFLFRSDFDVVSDEEVERALQGRCYTFQSVMIEGMWYLKVLRLEIIH